MIAVTMQEWMMLTYIRRHWQENGFAPSTMDIAIACHARSTNTVAYHLAKLEACGAVAFNYAYDGKRNPRTLTLCPVQIGVEP